MPAPGETAPLATVWDEVTRMLSDAPELETKTLFEYFLARPESELEETHLQTFIAGCGIGGPRGAGVRSSRPFSLRPISFWARIWGRLSLSVYSVDSVVTVCRSQIERATRPVVGMGTSLNCAVAANTLAVRCVRAGNDTSNR